MHFTDILLFVSFLLYIVLRFVKSILLNEYDDEFNAVLRGLLSLFSLFLVDILSHSQFLPTPTQPHYFYANLDNLKRSIFSKIGAPVAPPVKPETKH